MDKIQTIKPKVEVIQPQKPVNKNKSGIEQLLKSKHFMFPFIIGIILTILFLNISWFFLGAIGGIICTYFDERSRK